jgi:hypothetical protein
MALRLLVGRGTIRAEAWRHRRLVTAAEAGWTSPAELGERVAELVAVPELGAASRTCEVRLAAPVAQVRRLEGLPPVGGGALRPLVELRASHYFRRNGVALVVDARWDGSRRRSRVALAAAAPEPVVAALLEGARESGMEIRSIRPAASGYGQLDLLPRDERGRRTRRRFRRAAIIGVVGALFWLAAGAVYGARLVRADRVARADLDALGPAVEALAGLRREVLEAEATLRALGGADGRRGQVLGQALRAAAAVPDSAYLLSLAVDTVGRGRLSGLAPRAVGVVAALERAEVPAPRLEGEPAPVHADGVRRERFTLAFGRADP